MNEYIETFKAAVTRLGIRSIDAPEVFGVTRQTFSNWMTGKTSMPYDAFYTIVKIDNERFATQSRTQGEIADAVREIADRIKGGEFAMLSKRRAKRKQ